MDQIKSFTVAAEVAEAEDQEQVESWSFDLHTEGPDGKIIPDLTRTLTAYRPGDGQLAMVMADTGRHTNFTTKVAGAINFFHSVFEEHDAAYIAERLLDKGDKFGLKEVQEIMEWLIGEWTGHPTDSPSGSTPSRRTSGRKSAQAIPA